MLSGDCNICVNGKMPSYSATCVECGLSRKNYKPQTNADRIRAMTDEKLAEFLWAVWRHKDPFYKECVDGWPVPFFHWLKQEAQCTSE